MIREEKKFLQKIFLLVSLTVLAPAFFSYAVDPFHLFNLSLIKPVQFSKDYRFTNAGIINNFLGEEGMKGLVVGTSMMEQVDGNHVRQVSQLDQVERLILPGGSPEEILITLNRALETTEFREVFLGAHHTMGDPPGSYNGAGIPRFLYDDILLNDYQVLFNLDHFIISWRAILKSFRGSGYGVTDRNRMSISAPEAWAEKYNSVGIKELLKERMKKSKSVAILSFRSLINRPRSQFEQSPIRQFLEPVIKNNTKTLFHVLLHPYFATRYIGSHDFLERMISMHWTLVDLAVKYPNLRVYGFSDHEWIICDQMNYRDSEHYNAIVSRFIVESIFSGDGLLDVSSSPQYLEKVFSNIRDFEVDKGCEPEKLGSF